MTTEDQERATLTVVGDMTNAAADAMEKLRPGTKLARWDDLPHSTQVALAQGMHALLAPLAAMLELEAR